MTNQEKKEYLSKYQDVTREIKRLSDEIDRWRSASEKITPTYSLTPKGSNSTDKIQSAVEQIEAFTIQLVDKMLDQIRVRDEIETIINTVENSTLQLLLRYRYIEDCTWEEIAVKMHYAFRHVTRLHGIALTRLNVLD